MFVVLGKTNKRAKKHKSCGFWFLLPCIYIYLYIFLLKTVQIVTTDLPSPLRLWAIQVGAPILRNQSTGCLQCCDTRETQLYSPNPPFMRRPPDGPILVMGPRDRRISGGIPFFSGFPCQITVRGSAFEFESSRSTVQEVNSSSKGIDCSLS